MHIQSFAGVDIGTKKPIYVFSNGEFKRKDNTLFIENEYSKRYIPVEAVSELYLFGEVNLNTSLLNFLSQNEIIAHYFNYYGYYSDIVYNNNKQRNSPLSHKRRIFLIPKYMLFQLVEFHSY